MKKKKQKNFKEEYTSALLGFLGRRTEAALRAAYAFGKMALAKGIDGAEIINAHESAMAILLRSEKSNTELKACNRSASEFLSESLLPFEMSVRGYRETLKILRRSQERYRELIETARDFIYTLSIDGTIKSLNPVFETITGLKPDAWVGSDFALLVHPEDETFARQILARVIKGESPPMFDLRIRSKNGGYVIVEITTVPEFEESLVVGVFGIARDISERKNVYNQLKALAKRVIDTHEEERRRLSRQLNDDLCQWLSGTKMTVELIEESFAEANPKRKKLNELKVQINHRIEAIREMSTTLRPSALDDFGVATALNRLCEDTEQIFDIKVTFKKTDLLKAHYNSESEIAIYRIAQEALSNIVHHSHAVHARVLLRQTGQFLVLEITDDGSGFELNAVTKSHPIQAGTGLIAMRERATLIGGTFRIESSPGNGTSIRAEIPTSIPATL